MWLIQSQCPFSQTVPTDDAKKSPIGYTVLIHSEQYLHNKKEYLTESTSVVPTKDPSTVKLENISTTLEC